MQPIKDIKYILESMFTVFKHLFKKAVTLEYPEKKRELNDCFRGKLEVKLGEGGCVGCGMCKNVCPSGAINFEKNENNEVVSYTFNLKKCIFCGNCKFYCPYSAITMTKEYELASEDKKDLLLVYERKCE